VGKALQEDVLIKLRQLAAEGKGEEFFHKPVGVRQRFITDPIDPRDKYTFRRCCNTHIQWSHWDRTCRNYAITPLQGLPMIVSEGSDQDLEEFMKVVIRTLLVPVTPVKTFEELL